MLAPEFFIPMRSLTALFHVAMTGLSAADNIINFLETPENKNLSENKNFPNSSNIKIENFNFSYPNKEKTLDNINISFMANALTAIVGYSGCGKSTLASILAGEVRASESYKIGIETINFNNLTKEEISKNILKISHDAHIFESTVRENLAMAKPNASDEEMINILKQVKLWNTFENLNGLDTLLKSQGKNLSGGQAQRISLARALLYDAKVYIFDEATSNIDIESEEVILNIIYNLARTKTVIFISHRLASIKNASNIYVMDKGKIIQSGKHNDLYTQEGIYKDLYLYQEKLENYLKKEGKNEK